MLVLSEGIGRFIAEVEVVARRRCNTPGQAADGHVHRREQPGVGIALIRLIPPQPHPADGLLMSQMDAPRP